MRGTGAPLHVFYVQSFLSYLVALAVIRHAALANEDVLILLDRGVEPETGYRTLVVPESFSRPPRLSLRAVPANRREVRASRAFLATATGGRPFHAYLNRLSQWGYHHMTQMPGYQGVSLYEEGFKAYFTPLTPADNPPAPRPPLKRLVHALSGLPYRPAAGSYVDVYACAYATSERAMRGFPRRVQVDLAAVIADQGAQVGQRGFADIPPETTVFALPQPYRFHRDAAQADALEEAIVTCIKSAPGPVLFKPHPDRYDRRAFWEPLAARVEARTGLRMMDHQVPDLPLEVIATARPDITIAVVVSSLAVYAGMFRARVLSFARTVFGDEDQKVRDLIANSPGAVFAAPGETPEALAARLRVPLNSTPESTPETATKGAAP